LYKIPEHLATCASQSNERTRPVNVQINARTYSIDDCPDDILIEIFHFFTKPSLLRLVSKQWDRLVLQTPQIYSRLFQQALGFVPHLPTHRFREILFNLGQCDQSLYIKRGPFLFNTELAKGDCLPFLGEKILLLCNSGNHVNREIWDISPFPPHRIERTVFPQDLTTIMILSLLTDVTHLLNHNEFLTIYNFDECRIYDMNSGQHQILFQIKNSDSTVSCLSVAKKESEQFIIIGFTTGKCEVWDFKLRKRLSTLQSNYPISSVHFNAQNGLLAIGSQDGWLQIWKQIDGTWHCLQQGKVFNDPIRCLYLKGSLIAVGSRSRYDDEMDQIKLLFVHSLKNLYDFSVFDLACLALQGPELVMIHGNPLQLVRVDFSLSNGAFFSMMLNDPRSREEKLAIVAKRFLIIPEQDQKAMLKSSPLNLTENTLASFELNTANLNLFLKAAKSYYADKKVNQPDKMQADSTHSI
jgi:hypothetical protein